MLIKKYTDIYDYKIAEDKLFAIKKTGGLYIEDEFKLKGKLSFRGVVGEKLILMDEKKYSTIILDTHNETKVYIEEFGLSFIGNARLGNIVAKNNGEDIEYCIFDFTQNKVVEKINMLLGLNGPLKVYNNYFLSINQKEIGLFKFDNNPIWKLSFIDLLGSDNVLFHSDIVEYEGRLFFYVSGAEGQRTFCVDIETGKILNEYPELQGYSKIEGDNLYNLFFEKLRVLHIPTNAIKVYDMQLLLATNGIERPDYARWLVKDGLIYMAQNKGADKNAVDKGAVIAIVNPIQQQLLWKYSLPATCGMIGSLQLTNDRLFVHTQDSTLHIFEKDSSYL
jgi:hypothetical protein